MNYSPPQEVDLKFRPSYVEVGDAEVLRRYKETECELIISREGSEYVRRALAKISLNTRLDQLSSLTTNWDSYGSEPPSHPALATAARVVAGFIELGLIPDAVTPSPDGGVAICFVRNNKYADIECFNSGEVIAVRYSSTENPKAWPLPPDQLASDNVIQDFSSYLSS